MTEVEGAVLFTDIEGSTERWDRQPGPMRAALERHDAQLQAAFAAPGLRILKHTGDGVIVVAERTDALVAAAVEAQRRLRAVDWGELGGLAVRMGVHHGRFHARDDDLFGSDMNLAARLMGGAAGGQIVLSASALAAAPVPDGCRTEPLGRFRFRGVQEPVEVHSLLYPGGAPAYAPYRSSEEGLGNLAAPPIHLLGRAEDQARLAELIRTPGLVSLVGPGGIGKTSLAVSVAARARPSFPDGLWLADLTTIGSDGDVLPLLAQVLRLETPADGRLDERVAQTLTDRSLLLVVDNCEHVLQGVQAALQVVLLAGAKATILATTQIPLGHPAERPLSLGPLGTIDEQDAAVDLFLERAARAEGGHAHAPADRGAVLDLCRALDGLPLAIELAAARTATLGLAEIVGHLRDRFRLLAGSGTGRHDALERTIAWSHDLLEESEQRTLRRLSLFDGEFDLDQAAAAADLDGLGAADALGALVERSMVVRATRAGRRGFRLYESIRHFARDRLEEAAEREATVDRVTHRVVHIGRDAQLAIDGPDQLAWFDRLERELPSIRIAVEHLIERDPEGAVTLLVQLYQFWMARANRLEALRWHERALEASAAVAPGLAARAWADAGAIAYFCGDLERSRALCTASLSASVAGGRPARPTAVLRLAALEVLAGEVDAATTLAEQALDTLRLEHDPPEPPETMAAIGSLFAMVGQASRGVEVCQTAIASHRAPSPTTEASDLLNLAFAYRVVDQHQAVGAYLAARTRAEAAGSRFYAATAAMGAGLSLRAAGRSDEALATLAEALPMARDLGMRDEVLAMLRGAAKVLRVQGRVEGDLLHLVSERERRAQATEGGPHLGRRPGRSSVELAAELGSAYGDLAAAAAELGVDEAIDLVGRAALGAHAPEG